MDPDYSATGKRWDFEAMFESFSKSREWATGFIAAIVSGPGGVHPFEWIGELRSIDDVTSEEASVHQIATIVKHAANIARALESAPATLCPAADDPERIAELCAGYMRGAKMHEKWDEDPRAARLLLRIGVLAGQIDDGHLVGDDGKPLDAETWKGIERERLPETLKDLSAWSRLKATVRRESEKVGRNDPCPCGSGKKHKKCCGA